MITACATAHCHDRNIDGDCTFIRFRSRAYAFVLKIEGQSMRQSIPRDTPASVRDLCELGMMKSQMFAVAICLSSARMELSTRRPETCLHDCSECSGTWTRESAYTRLAVGCCADGRRAAPAESPPRHARTPARYVRATSSQSRSRAPARPHPLAVARGEPRGCLAITTCGSGTSCRSSRTSLPRCR
jgi:hypothetical protein